MKTIRVFCSMVALLIIVESATTTTSYFFKENAIENETRICGSTITKASPPLSLEKMHSDQNSWGFGKFHEKTYTSLLTSPTSDPYLPTFSRFNERGIAAVECNVASSSTGQSKDTHCEKEEAIEFEQELREFDSILRNYVSETSYDFHWFELEYKLRKSQFSLLQRRYLDIISDDKCCVSGIYNDVEFHFLGMELHHDLSHFLQNTDRLSEYVREVNMRSLQLLEFDLSLQFFSGKLSMLPTRFRELRRVYDFKVHQLSQLKDSIETLYPRDESLSRRLAGIVSYLENFEKLLIRAELMGSQMEADLILNAQNDQIIQKNPNCSAFPYTSPE
ncbi:hypothetical protein JCM33374_g2620 [Metschnikowia sp. JCM 33374]|nr:hypothetical protein JCM33374_g2620 [Metschnikowia sp. JCM 33374]